jgi:hypothetical protein
VVVQFEFWKNLPTKKALFSFAEEVLSAFNNEMHVGGISFDFTKAFDCRNHKFVMEFEI